MPRSVSKWQLRTLNTTVRWVHLKGGSNHANSTVQQPCGTPGLVPRVLKREQSVVTTEGWRL